MRTTSAERMKLHRDRRRLGQRPVQMLVSEQELDFLLASGYQLSRQNRAVSQFLSDSALFMPGHYYRSCRR